MITAESKLAHAHRLLRDVPPHRLRVLRQIAKREGRWQHVDWNRVDDPTPPPPAPTINCIRCGEAVEIAGNVCPACKRDLEARRKEQKANAPESDPDESGRAAWRRAKRPAVKCIDCGAPLPAGRQRGRCLACRNKRANVTARGRMRRHRRSRRAAVVETLVS